MSLGISLKRDFYPEKIARQMTFATAKALTVTAKQAQGAVMANLPGNFTLRTNWANQSNKFGVRVKSATKTDLRSEIGTNADWLDKFETGDDKTPGKKYIAIPTDNVRRNKKMLIPRNQRPNALREKRTVVLTTKNGNKVLFQRKYKGKRSQLIALYNLEERAKIKKISPIIVPAVRIVRGRLTKNFSEAFVNALKTAR
jgi:hypothetical protein